jgi:hypothetical protein
MNIGFTITLLLEKMAMCFELLSQSYALKRGYRTLSIKLQQVNYVLQQQIKARKTTCKAIICPIGCEQQPFFIQAQTKPLFKTKFKYNCSFHYWNHLVSTIGTTLL